MHACCFLQVLDNDLMVRRNPQWRSLPKTRDRVRGICLLPQGYPREAIFSHITSELALFGRTYKPADKPKWLILYERKTLLEWMISSSEGRGEKLPNWQQWEERI